MDKFDYNDFFPSRVAARTIYDAASRLVNESDYAKAQKLADEFITTTVNELMHPLEVQGIDETPAEYKYVIKRFFKRIAEEIDAEPYDGSDSSTVVIWASDMLYITNVICEEQREVYVGEEFCERHIYIQAGVFSKLLDAVSERMKALAAKVYG